MIDEFYSSGPAYIPSDWELIVDTITATSKFRIRNTTFPPFITLNVENMPFGSKYYTGVQFPENITFEIEERNDFSTFLILQNEFNRIYNYNTRKFRKLEGENSFPNGTLTLFRGEKGPEGNHTRVKVASFDFLNMRIISLGDLTFDQSTADLLAYTVTFSVEEVIPSTLNNTQ